MWAGVRSGVSLERDCRTPLAQSQAQTHPGARDCCIAQASRQGNLLSPCRVVTIQLRSQKYVGLEADRFVLLVLPGRHS